MVDVAADCLQQSRAINSAIFKHGPALLDAVKETILQEATVPPAGGPAAHQANQEKLLATIARICEEGQWNQDLGKAQFWDTAWGRIVYQGTRADKATKEIESMRQYPLFADFNVFDKASFHFDKAQWEAFSTHWKRRFKWYKLVQRFRQRLQSDAAYADLAWLKAAYRKSRDDDASADQDETDTAGGHAAATPNRGKWANDSESIYWGTAAEDWPALTRQWSKTALKYDNWLDFAKGQGALWDESLQGFAPHYPSMALDLMTKSGRFEGIQFSSHAAKMEKYLAVAEFLKSAPETEILGYYTGRDYRHEVLHTTGAAYLRSKQRFDEIHAKFREHFGDITSLHLMMDLGFMTVKPDRVLTYLFSRLGWLLTLPKSLTKEQVLKKYTNPKVVQEVLHRADVLAASLVEHCGTAYTHRLLDIWMVKFGQEPEEQFGITVNLEDASPKAMERLYEKVAQRLAAAPADSGEPEDRWPSAIAFAPLPSKGRPRPVKAKRAPAASRARPARVVQQPREQAMLEEMHRYYLEHKQSIPANISKFREEIVRLMMAGLPAADAFRQVQRK